MLMQTAPKISRYIGGIICTVGGIYLGNGYGASYWRFTPFNLAWDTLVRGSLLIAVGFFLIAISK
jgi:hypothetical protein